MEHQLKGRVAGAGVGVTFLSYCASNLASVLSGR